MGYGWLKKISEPNIQLLNETPHISEKITIDLLIILVISFVSMFNSS